MGKRPAGLLLSMGETHVTDDEAALKRAVEAILMAINNKRVAHPVALLACANAIGVILASMQCSACRQVAASSIQADLPGLINHHLTHATASPPGHMHVH
jgi:hypothetical protein